MRRRFSSQFLGMNSSLIYEGDSAYLVDPGVFPKEVERIKNFIDQQNIRNLIVLLTHTHGDHISGWSAFREYPTYGHQAVSEKSQSVRDNDVRYLQGVFRKQGLEKIDHLMFPDNIRYVADGELRGIDPYSFTFFHVPGHATDMSAIVIPEERLLLSGDMLIQIPAPFILNSTRKYWQSLKRFKKLVTDYDLDCLIPGHGKPAKSQQDIMRRIEHEQEYLHQLIWEGVKLAKTGITGDELKKELFRNFKEYANLHSHQTNVQTFMRELDDWLADQDLDLFID